MWIWAPQLLFLQLLIAAAVAFAASDEFQNPDFESPPSSIPFDSATVTFVPLNSTINSIPGWSFRGSVQYVNNGPKISLPTEREFGHSIRLGVRGRINQTIKASEGKMHCWLTLALAPANCSTDGKPAPSRSLTISFPNKTLNVLSKATWETHGVYLGNHGDGKLLNLILENRETTCGGLFLDSMILKKIQNPIEIRGNNLVLNGGFEIGPAFPEKSTNAVLIDEALDPTQSPLLGWYTVGSVKYITSKRGYSVPAGKAAVEIITTDSLAGIQTAPTLNKGSTYRLEFQLGDARDGRVGEFVVGVSAGGWKSENFTLESRGRGETQTCTMTFKADSNFTPISFLSHKMTMADDSVYCGPLIDSVVLLPSYGLKVEWPYMLQLSCMVFLVIMFL